MNTPTLAIGNDIEYVRFQPSTRPNEEGWLDVDVTIAVGGWHGIIDAQFLKWDFHNFKKALEELGTSESMSAEFSPLEPWVELKLQGDRLGNISIKGIALDRLGTGNKLEFQLPMIDQTFIPKLLIDLDAMIQWMQ